MEQTYIIIATDKDDIAEQIAEELPGPTCDVLAAHTPTECTELLLQGKGDVLILDLLMAKSAGLELFLAWRKHWSWLPLITFTQCPEGEAKVTLGQSDSHPLHPFKKMDPLEILQCVRKCLREPCTA